MRGGGVGEVVLKMALFIAGPRLPTEVCRLRVEPFDPSFDFVRLYDGLLIGPRERG